MTWYRSTSQFLGRRVGDRRFLVFFVGTPTKSQLGEMHFLTRAFAAQIWRSSRASRKLLSPTTALQHSSPYSSSAAAWQNSARKPKTQQAPNVVEPVRKDHCPRPSEIPWQVKVANSVNLIGRVKIPVQSQASSDGKFWAGTIIAQQDTNALHPFWIPVVFEGDLAHIAACHLKEKDCVHIAGQLNADFPPFALGEGQANVQVMAHSINFVQGSSITKESVIASKQEESAIKRSAGSMTKDGDVKNKPWKDLIQNPEQWSDYREKKLKGLVKEKYPDFKHKVSGTALWLDGAPSWVFPGLEALKLDVPLQKVKPVEDQKDVSWKNLVENPYEWWDNRSKKVNAKSPDFKHKVTGKPLWLSSSPVWALTKLPPMKADQNDATYKTRTPKART
ncbi:hypothetical protein RJ640_001777 [Escallonia rubra]|uniref:Uncharacterized protein n=1 Tax=Escallonia rubra TaxID=112253 RepID=A0AA88RI47_9ASTE|nr:hypothetical protein RJ640_001777 [Escallonia rubra]